MKPFSHSGLVCQLCAFLIAAFVSFHAFAQDENSAKLASVSTDILELKAFVDANGTFCSAFSSDNAPVVDTAISDWYRSNRVDNVANIINDVLRPKTDPELKLRRQHLSELESKVRTRAAEWCERFVTTLKSDKMNLSRSYAAKLRTLNRSHARKVHKRNGPDQAPARKFSSLPIVESGLYQDLVEAGVDLSITPINTEFRCYGFRPGSDYNVPDFIIQLASNNTYKSTFGPGSFVGNVDEDGKLTSNLTWIGPLGKFKSSRVNNNYKFGQRIKFEKLDIAGTRQNYICYQQGARERAALTTFKLKDPGTGDYQCRDSEGKSRSTFSIVKGYRYSAGKQSGRYTVDIRSSDDTDSEVKFVSGPLEGTSAEYKEQAGTGLKKFSFKKVSSHFLSPSSTSSLDMTCSSVGDTTDFERYGTESVPAPPAGSGGMFGLYAKRRKADSTKSSKYDFYVFTPEGRVYSGEPDISVKDINCLSSHPSGKPRCNTYRTDGGNIIFNNGSRDYKTLQQDDLLAVKSDVNTLAGKYSAAIGDASGFCSPFSTCSSWYRQSVRQFTADGQFSKSGKSLNTISAGSGVGTGHGMGSSNSSTSGQYEIKGSQIHLYYGNGVVETQFIAPISDSTIHIAGWTYSLNKD